MQQAKVLIERMKEKSQNKKIDVVYEMTKFVSTTSALCFLNVPISDSFFEILMDYTNCINDVVVKTYLFPKWMLKLYYGRTLAAFRKKLLVEMLPQIQLYKEDLNLKTSPVLRACVDYKDPDGKKLSDDEIGEVIACLLYISSENTALGLSAVLTNLACNKEFWERVKEETKESL